MMELFSEIYNCYYQIVDVILKKAECSPISKNEIDKVCKELGFYESSLYILPKLISGDWNLLQSCNNHQAFSARTKNHGSLPLTLLQKSWLKTLLFDKRIKLFFDKDTLSILSDYLKNVQPLWNPDDFYYYDQYSNGDHYDSEVYQQHFQNLLLAISQKQYITISYLANKGKNRITHHYLPLKLEYSAKNDRFRLLALLEQRQGCSNINIINLDTILETSLLDKYGKEDLDFAALIRNSYYKEPVKILIFNQRNTLERAMLHFSNYEKQTRKIDESTWECLIYYNRSMETELLIEILSFGPTIKVLGPESFLSQIKKRIFQQKELFSKPS